MKPRTGVWRRFEAERLVRGQTQSELAESLGVTQSYYSKVSRERVLPKLSFLNALLRRFPEYYHDFHSLYIVPPSDDAASPSC